MQSFTTWGCLLTFVRQTQTVKDCIKLMKLYSVYEQQMSNNISPGGHQWATLPPLGVLWKLCGDVWRRTITDFKPSGVVCFLEFGGFLGIWQEGERFSNWSWLLQLDCGWRQSWWSNHHRILTSCATSSFATLHKAKSNSQTWCWPLEVFQRSLHPSAKPVLWFGEPFATLNLLGVPNISRLWQLARLVSVKHAWNPTNVCSKYSHKFTTWCNWWSASSLTLGVAGFLFARSSSVGSWTRNFGQRFYPRFSSQRRFASFLEVCNASYWFLEELTLTDGKLFGFPNSVSQVHPLPQWKQHTRCSFTKRTNVAKLQVCIQSVQTSHGQWLSCFMKSCGIKSARRTTPCMCSCKIPATLFGRKNLNPSGLTKWWHALACNLKCTKHPWEKEDFGRAKQPNSMACARLWQPLWTCPMMLYLQWLALAHFSSQGAKNWAFCWMLEALFEVGQASIPDAVLDRMGLAKDDPTIVAMPNNLPQWCRKSSIPDLPLEALWSSLILHWHMSSGQMNGVGGELPWMFSICSS